MSAFRTALLQDLILKRGKKGYNGRKQEMNLTEMTGDFVGKVEKICF